MNINYDRQKAVSYARRWALRRNPEFYDYSSIGGDCTNFVSQCVYAGIEVMNYSTENGWYYINANNKSPSWTGVTFFYDFLVNNKGAGPYGIETELENLLPGDVIQLGDRNNNFYHTLILTAIMRGFRGRRYYICAHSQDAYQRDLFSYRFDSLRCVHILGGRDE